jgi:hypothetical protein
MIGAENVGALLHASQKYQLESLISDCEKYLQQNLALHNACTVLQQATDFALFDLANCAHNYMCEHATDIISSEDFMSPNFLTDTFVMHEEELQHFQHQS